VQFWSFFFKFDHPWNKISNSCSSDFWNSSRMPYFVFKSKLTHYAARWRQRSELFENGNFERPSLRETIFGWELYWCSSKDLLWSIYFADRWRCKCAVRTPARKHVQGGKFVHPSLPHISPTAIKFTASLELSAFYKTWLVLSSYVI